MEHLYERGYTQNATPIFTDGWAQEVAAMPGESQAEFRYKKTRSTLAVDAYDIFDLEDEYAVAAFKSLIRHCKILGRDEIVIENLDVTPMDTAEWSINDSLNSIQSDIIHACRQMNLYPPRVSLEKRGQHFDLRIYPTYH